MDRPSLARLMNDIAQRRVDIVVVYKVDRLTRSLLASWLVLFWCHGTSISRATKVLAGYRSPIAGFHFACVYRGWSISNTLGPYEAPSTLRHAGDTGLDRHQVGGVPGVRSCLARGERSRGKSTERRLPVLDGAVDIQAVYAEIIEDCSQVARGWNEGTVSHRDSGTAA
jgi:hypothetical protein